MSRSSDDLPAILGGKPIRPEGPPEWPGENPAVDAAIRSVIADRSWGKYHAGNCETLIRKFAEYHGCEHAVLCSSGTAAIELALRGLKVGPGDEVILAAYDFKGNFGDVTAIGATPVLVDVDPANWNLDPDRLGDAIGEKTKAIIVSHLHGGIVPMPAVMEIARRHAIPVVEDACQMPGAVVHGRKAGTWGNVGAFSFGGSKLLSAGRGGAFITDNADIVQRAKLYSHRGNEAYPLSEIQAALLLPQLEQLDEANNRRRENVALLCGLLEEGGGLRPFQNADTDRSRAAVTHSQPGYYKLGFQYEPAAFEGLPRDLFASAMRAEGIAMDAGFRSLGRIHSRRRFRCAGQLSNADAADERVLVLHHPVLLGTEADIGQIAAALDKVRRHATMIRAERV